MKSTRLMKMISGIIILSFAAVSVWDSPPCLADGGVWGQSLAPQTRIEHKKPVAVVALGGNAFNDLPIMAKRIVDLSEAGYEVVVTHGNGPQVGKLLGKYSNWALSILVGLTQKQMGRQLQAEIEAELSRRGIKKGVEYLLTSVKVDPNDIAFKNPTKPIGPRYLTREEAEEAAMRMGNLPVGEEITTDGVRYRPLVASPKPQEVLNLSRIQESLDKGNIVIAVGGGGVPVRMKPWIGRAGVAAVIDKDRASSVLARQLGAKLFVILTEVSQVAENFGKPTQKNLPYLTVAGAKRFLEEGHAGKGDMRPKVESTAAFVEATGNDAIITDAASLPDALRGTAGTYILNDEEAKGLAFIEGIESELHDIGSGITDIAWQLYTAIAVKKMSPEERANYLATLTEDERTKLDNARGEVFLSDFSDDENPGPDDLRIALIKEEKGLRERTNEIAQKNIDAVVSLRKSGRVRYPILKRKLDSIYYSFLSAAVEVDPEVFEGEKALEKTFSNFDMVKLLEKQLDPSEFNRLSKRYNFNEGLDDAKVQNILREEEKEGIRKAVWMVFVKRGEACADMRIKLIAAQNRAIRRISKKYGLRYENYHQFSLESQEFDYEAYTAMMNKLDAGTKLKRQEAVKSARAKLGETPLEPWNATRANHAAYIEAERYFTADVIARAFHDTFSRLGFDTSKIHMDRNERSGRLSIKDPHPGSCFPVDPIKGDVRLLSCPGNGILPAYALLHETGHAVHYLNCPRNAGPILCSTHVVTTENIATYMEDLIYDPEWLLENTSMPKELVARFLIATHEEDLMGPRGAGNAIAVAHFDKTMYEVVGLYYDAPTKYKAQYGDKTPVEVLTKIYWDNYSEKMGFPAKDELAEFYKLPRWAGIYHFLLTTAYMPIGYEYAETLDAQNKALIRKRFGGIINKEAGKWLNDNYFRWGDIIPWQDIARLALSEGVNPEPRIREHQMTDEEIREEVEMAAKRVEERRQLIEREQASESL